MISPRDILNVTFKIRRELGYPIKSIPKIISVFSNDSERKLYIVCGDRADRSVLIGPGGRVVYEIARKLNYEIVIIRALTDILVSFERIRQSIEKARKVIEKIHDNRVKKVIENKIIPLAKEHMRIVSRKWKVKLNDINYSTDVKTVIAFSGGVDSAATLIYVKNIGLKNLSITVDPGPFIIPNHVKSKIIDFTRKNKIEHKFTNSIEEYDEIISKARSGHRIPCKACHEIIKRTVVREAIANDARIIFFGDLLPTGYHSIRLIGGELIRINLPAFLALTKTDTIIISKIHGYGDTKLIYGCPLLRYSMKKNRHFKYIAIQRVLRETRAGILEPNQALELIKSIIEL
ncbi:MAG: hypothetical protein DRJ21_00555 [Candidatus Methanomethylicota archaeon]|uniref:ATPase n=1 Tax=Thermoproteota archaeon TaxID=2056631 RepID=A0A497EW38_9CREN|nr:MAG: hypothetical protein DRJ21_00555 [Candidatus Verstraetearchaeota archaeon]